MTIFDAIRDRLSTRSSSTSATAAADEQGVPFAGYDQLDRREVLDQLSKHSQVELDAAEAYERAHKGRESVLDKLRYMRGSEPMPDYDSLSAKEIMAALDKADTATIKKVRGYERKFANRPDVLEEVARVHHRRLAAQTQEPSGRP